MSIELICPAGNLPALKVAVDNGADAVYLGFKNTTNARAFPGLNFDHNKYLLNQKGVIILVQKELIGWWNHL